MKALFVLFLSNLGLASENQPENQRVECHHHFVPPSLLIRSPGMESLQQALTEYLLEDEESDSDQSSSDDEGYEPSSDEGV